MTVPSLEDTVGLDTSDPTTLGRVFGMEGMDADSDAPKRPEEERETRFLKLAQEAETQAVQNIGSGLRAAWTRAYQAYGNRHPSGSKYHSDQYRGRSKLFRPKTRIAIRKKLKEAATALFSTGDVVSVQPTDESDFARSASAELKQELINYRLRSKSVRAGIQWFQIALGALETAQIAGVCASKQSWIYREDPDDGEVMIDRPDIQLYPPENVLIDPNADWTNPVQLGQFVGLRNFYSADDAWQMVRRAAENGSRIPWVSGLTKQDFLSRASGGGPSDTAATRAARDGKTDPMQQTTKSFGRCPVIEWFMRVDGREVVFWTLGTDKLISTPIALKKAYPEQRGERPVTMGVGAIEAFKVHPMSPVESWQPLQQEANDAVNLRLDHMKQIISPPTLVKRGKKVDLGAVQARGPNRLIMVDDMDDVSTMPMSDTPQGAFAENNNLNADMDDLSGTMNTGTVSTARNLNETVGGMSMMMGDSNAMSEYDLSVWVETWATPTLIQILRLEERYEDDAVILALCGQKAKLIEKYGIDEITDFLLEHDTELVLQIGIGASAHPAQRLQKFAAAGQTAAMLLTPFVAGGVVHSPVPKVKTIIDEVYGNAGFKNASDRFFQPIDDNQAPEPPQPPQPDPAKMAELQSRERIAQLNASTKMQELGQRSREHMDRLTDSADERAARQRADYIKTMADVGRDILKARQQREQHQAQLQHDRVKAQIAETAQNQRDQAMNMHEMLEAALSRQKELRMAVHGERSAALHTVIDHHAQAARAEQSHRHEMERTAHERAEAETQRAHEAEQKDADREHAKTLEKERAKNKPKPQPAGARPKPKKDKK